MRFFVTGTDTDVGKTVVSAWLMLQLHASYWKPVQCGLDDGTDAERIYRITECPEERILPSAYILEAPLSPHEAARRANITIEMDRFVLPAIEGPLIVEGAGGLLVPLNAKHMVIDLIAKLGLPVILVCRSTLGTINHTLLSIEALCQRHIPIAGIVLNGPKTPHNRQAIETYSNIDILAEIPPLDSVDRNALRAITVEKNLNPISP